MANKSNFTPDEWNLLSRAPAMAGLVVVAASPSGPLGVLKESMAIGKVLTRAKTPGASSELISALAADMTSPEGRSAMASELMGKSPDEIRAHALDSVRRAVALVDQKASSESQAVKLWLLSIGRTVAAAAREGGFLGIGGTEVSDNEKTALRDLGQSLGVVA